MSEKSTVTLEQKKILGRDCPLFRATWVKLTKAEQFQGKGDAKFSLEAIIDKKDKAGVDLFKQKIRAAMVEKFGPDQKKWAKNPQNPWWNPLRDGDVEKADKPEYQGKYFIKFAAKEEKRPQVIGRQGEGLEPSEIYSGCYCKASVIAYAYDFQGKRGAGFALMGVQFVKDGERLDRADVSGEFDSVDSTDGSESEENYEEADEASGF